LLGAFAGRNARLQESLKQQIEDEPCTQIGRVSTAELFELSTQLMLQEFDKERARSVAARSR
jgi:hypothetical protein